ncbi:hypothetical protein [Winogradskyella sp. MIT101101]|uniref:hypothetical protein n=1 Tax=Winogradskyella sp. MIT101101 TaxID=3098297 RepID=UPI00399B2B39
MLTKKHILFLVPDGVGIRNFLYSDIIKHLKTETDISIWSTLPIEAFKDVERLHKTDFNYQQIVLQPENSKTRLFREATTFARLKRNAKIKNNPNILTNWNRASYSIKVKLLYRLAEILGNYCTKSYERILSFEKKSRECISQQIIDAYKEKLEAINPSALFITHQRVPGLMPICLAAEQLGIETATAIFSWDNLPKARLSVKTNTYLVWSKWMKDEMKDYYPEIPKENVKLVGTPQFEFYLDHNRKDERVDFAKAHGLDSNKKWICFSGDDLKTSPHDQLFLRDMAEALVDMRNEIQIIFRRCPVDFSNRYGEVLNTYRNLIVPIDPLWNIQSKTGWIGYFPKYEDINMQVNLAYHCELVVNLGSTMALDFATHNKPCLYLNYNPSIEGNWSSEIVYNYQHFRSMKGLNPVGWINNKNEIAPLTLKALNQPNEVGPDKRIWLKKLVLHPLDQNSHNIAKELL